MSKNFPNDPVMDGEVAEQGYRDILEQCPRCRYSLYGLPKAYSCPECGFQYSPAHRVWTTHGKRGRSMTLWLVVLSIMGLAVFLGYVKLRRKPMPNQVRVVLPWIVAAGLSVVGMQSVRKSRRNAIVVATPGAVELEQSGLATQAIPWSRIKSITIKSLGSRRFVRLSLSAPPSQVDLSNVIQTEHEVDEFLRFARSHSGRAASITRDSE